jgi:hypothetical protein
VSRRAEDLSRSELEEIVECVASTLRQGSLLHDGHTPCWIALRPLMGKQFVDDAIEAAGIGDISRRIFESLGDPSYPQGGQS